MNKVVYLSVFAGLLLEACGNDSSSSPEPAELSSAVEEPYSSVLSSSSEVSSSSERLEESSSSISSSSGPYVEKHLAWQYMNPAISYGEITDERDGHVYRYMEYDGMRVMAENMNYSDSVASPNLRGSTWCPYDNLDSCSKYGRFYTWAAAMDLDHSYNGKEYDFNATYPFHQGVCPEGWSVYANSFVWKHMSFGNVYEGKLCAQRGWPDPRCSDSLGFSALPNGYLEDGVLQRPDSAFSYWTLVFQKADEASMGLYSIWNETFAWNAVTHSKKHGAGVRCMQMIPQESSSSAAEESSSSATEESSSSEAQDPESGSGETEVSSSSEVLDDGDI